jgi:hypothetical protein
MKSGQGFISLAMIAGAMLLGPAPPASADNEVVFGPVRDEFPFEVDDYSGCTGEVLHWTAILSTFDYLHISGHGAKQTMHVVSQFRWTATIEGTTSGYVWETEGGGRDILNADLADGSPTREIFIENSVLKPASPGAPRVNFSALIRTRDDGEGGVIESVKYEYRCIGR